VAAGLPRLVPPFVTLEELSISAFPAIRTTGPGNALAGS
jgi:hypothetical protein